MNIGKKSYGVIGSPDPHLKQKHKEAKVQEEIKQGKRFTTTQINEMNNSGRRVYQLGDTHMYGTYKVMEIPAPIANPKALLTNELAPKIGKTKGILNKLFNYIGKILKAIK